MKPFIIFGNGDFADIVEYIIVEEMHEEVAGYTVNEAFLSDSEWKGKPVVPLERIEKYFNPVLYNFSIAYEGRDLYGTRETIMAAMAERGFSFENVISSSANVTNARIGVGNIIMQDVLIAPFAELGDGNVFWGTSQIQHHNRVGNFNCFAPGMATCGYTVIPDHCFFGANCTIKSGIHISNRTFVGANAYVDNDTDVGAVWLPARSSAKK